MEWRFETVGKAIDETGKIYGYLTVLERAGPKQPRNVAMLL